jgi:hypothetical protein
MSILLGPFTSLTSMAAWPFAGVFAGAAFALCSPSLLTCFVTLALIESKVFLRCDGKDLVSKMSQILTASAFSFLYS